MNTVFQASFGKSIRVFIDDFCIYRSRALHAQFVEEGLKKIYDSGGQLNSDKCHMGEDEVILLGHKVSYKGIEVDLSKAKALIDLPSLKSIKEVVSFVQEVKYMSRFIHLASELLHPLQRRILVTKEIPAILEGLHEEAYGGHFAQELTVKKILLAGFGTPLEIVFNNGPGFRKGLLTEVCEELHILHWHSTPYYSLSNGLVENANGIIVRIIRKMVKNKTKLWDDFLDGALWAYRTTYKEAIEFKPFHLVYGHEALQPITLNIPTMRLHGKAAQGEEEAWTDRLLTLWQRPYIVKDAFNSRYYQSMDLDGKEHPRKVNGYRSKPYLWHSTKGSARLVSTKGYIVICHNSQVNGNKRLLYGPQQAVITNGSFEKWGIDAMGPLPGTANGKLYILVVIDYMTRFGTPREIVSHNGLGFRRGLLTEVCEELKISHRHSTPYYPQSNGLVEKANGIIADIIRKMVES
ncbi:hypothetical protein L7F22_005145 [Adiantum nelumboides]|nr:hypothetical protein [Adiantum nelumboides]